METDRTATLDRTNSLSLLDFAGDSSTMRKIRALQLLSLYGTLALAGDATEGAIIALRNLSPYETPAFGGR